jgi:hypothetical protein
MHRLAGREGELALQRRTTADRPQVLEYYNPRAASDDVRVHAQPAVHVLHGLPVDFLGVHDAFARAEAPDSL